MHVRFTDDARCDLRAIKAYISQDNSIVANRVIDRILTTISQLEAFPFLGREGRVDGTREIIVPRVSYFIVYSIFDEYTIDIDRVMHTARDYPNLRRRSKR